MENSLYKELNNNKKLLSILRCNTSIDKTNLAKMINVSWPTMSNTLKNLEKNHVLTMDGLRLNSNIGYYIGISIGGSQTKLCMIDFSYRILTKDNLRKLCYGNAIFSDKENYYLSSNSYDDNYGYLYFNTPKSFSELHDRIESIFDDIITLNENHYDIYGVGIAFTGAIDNKKKIIIRSHNIPYLKNINFDTLISRKQINYCKEQNINIAFEHNAKAAIVAEKYSLYEEHSKDYEYKDCKNLACIYLGSGIGMGYIFNNQLYRGTGNFSGELGHIKSMSLSTISPRTDLDPACTCGSKDCLEYHIRNEVFEMTLDQFKSATTAQLRACIKEKDGHLELLGKYIGYIINVVINLLDIDLIILTGKLTTFLDDGELWKYVNNEKRQMNLEYTNMDCSLITSTYGALAPSIGAAICSSYESSETIEWI